MIARIATTTEGAALSAGQGLCLDDLIIERVCHHLHEHQHREQSGFPPKRSMIARILALQVLTECRGEFQQGMLAACVDLCKVVDSVNRDAYWRILSLRGVPPKLINLISEL